MTSVGPTIPSVAVWAYLVAGIGFGAFAIQLCIGSRGGYRGRLVLAAVASSSVWAFSAAIYAYSGQVLAIMSAGLFDTLRMCVWCAFLLSLLTSHHSMRETRLNTWLASGIGLLALARLIFEVWPDFGVGLLGKDNRIQFGPMLALAVVGLLLVEQVFRNISSQARWSVKPLCLGLGAVFCFDMYLCADAFLFNRVNPDLWAGRGIANMLVVPLIAVSAARNKGWALDIAISRQVVFHSTTLFSSGIYLLAIAGAGYYVRYVGGTWGGALQVLFLFLGLLILSLLVFSGSVRSKFRVLVNKHFFSYRYDYREEWLRFTSAFASGDAQMTTAERAIQALADLVESPGGALWWAEGPGPLKQVARLNAPVTHDDEPRDGMLFYFLSNTKWVIDLRERHEQPEKYNITMPAWLDAMANAWLVVPLFADNDLFGFVVLLKPRAKVDVNWEVRDLLKTAARQAASYLAHMHAAEALLEAKKFEAFNRMSAFVVHDVKNLVAQLSLLLKNAERHKHNPEFQNDMLMTIDNVVERMKHLLLQLRVGTAPVNQPAPVDLAPIVDRIAHSRSGQKPLVTVECGAKIHVMGHADRIERVIGHLVQNAIDATPREGKVSLRLICNNGQAIVEVKDTGHGMNEAFIRERLFKPFQTTKAAGMGIGAYESSQYIREIGGKISVDSQERVGTVVRIELPANPLKIDFARESREEV